MKEFLSKEKQPEIVTRVPIRKKNRSNYVSIFMNIPENPEPTLRLGYSEPRRIEEMSVKRLAKGLEGQMTADDSDEDLFKTIKYYV